MRKQVIKIAVFAGILAFSVNMNAQEKSRAMKVNEHRIESPENMMKRLDKNQDGSISMDEAREYKGKFFKKNFYKMDTDKDKEISIEELKTAYIKRKEMQNPENKVKMRNERIEQMKKKK